MFRQIRTSRYTQPDSRFDIERLPSLPGQLNFDLQELFGSATRNIAVETGQHVEAGTLLVGTDTADLHAPAAAKVVSLASECITLEPSKPDWKVNGAAPSEDDVFADFPGFLRRIGLRGMGGSRFPASIKVKASMNVATFILNAAECEPLVTIDHALLLNQLDLIKAGIEATVRATRAKRVIVAVRNDKTQIKQLGHLPYELLVLPNKYPAGAEKLIIAQHLGKMPPAGMLPFELGILVQNVASIRALGMALLDGIPVIERPLSVIAPAQGIHRNLIVPIGMRIADVLNVAGCRPTDQEAMVIGGMMMGQKAHRDDTVNKGTTSVVLVPERELRGQERSCIRCGACNNGCPLNLHPIGMVERLADGDLSLPLKSQLQECFLCGVCSSVCPSNIPLAAKLREGKSCL